MKWEKHLIISYHSGAENNHYVLIIGHGLDGNKDTPLILELSNKVSNEGMSVLRFSFSGNGNSQGKFTEKHNFKRHYRFAGGYNTSL